MNKQLIQSCIDRQVKAITALKEFVETDQYKSLYKDLWYTINNGGRIFISGVGKNSNIATKISESMASLGIPSGYINPTNYLHGDAGYLTEKDCVIYITRSGKTDEIHAMAKHLYINRPHISQDLIHCNRSAIFELRKFEPFTRVMFIPNVREGDELELAPTSSTTVFLCLLDTITVALSSDLEFTKEDFLSYHPGGNLGNILRKEVNV